jgi:uncharacterized membrane protein
MFPVEHTVTVNRPAQVVFDYIADGTNNRAWRPTVLEIERTSAADGMGSTYRQVSNSGPGGTRLKEDYRVTVFDPPRRLEFLITAGPVRPTGVFELAENPDKSTRVRFALDLKTTGFLRLLSSTLAKRMQKEVDALDNLKVVLERAS